MADVSFIHVPAEGFTSFGMQLDRDVWGSIDISPYLGADGRLLKPLGQAPAFVVYKVQLTSAMRSVLGVAGSTAVAKGCDEAWDMTQKRFSGLIAIARLSANPDEKAAAERLHAALLQGEGGQGQTQLKYHEEIDYGRNQVKLALEPWCAADLTRLGLQSEMAAIASTTEDLAAAMAHGHTHLAPSKQRKAALAECARVFGTVYRALDWLAEHGDPDADQAAALAMRASMQQLLDKYPAVRPAKAKQVAQPAPVSGPVL